MIISCNVIDTNSVGIPSLIWSNIEMGEVLYSNKTFLHLVKPCCFECQRREGAKMTRMLLQLWDSVCHGGITVWDRVSLCYMSVSFMLYVKGMNDPWQDTLEFASLSA